MNSPQQNRQDRFKELLFLQLKLALDALVDFLLSPVVMVCGLVDIVRGHGPETSWLKRLKATGLRYEHWLHLFGDGKEAGGESGSGADRLLRHAELRARRHWRKQRKSRASESPDAPL